MDNCNRKQEKPQGTLQKQKVEKESYKKAAFQKYVIPILVCFIVLMYTSYTYWQRYKSENIHIAFQYESGSLYGLQCKANAITIPNGISHGIILQPLSNQMDFIIDSSSLNIYSNENGENIMWTLESDGRIENLCVRINSGPAVSIGGLASLERIETEEGRSTRFSVHSLTTISHEADITVNNGTFYYMPDELNKAVDFTVDLFWEDFEKQTIEMSESYSELGIINYLQQAELEIVNNQNVEVGISNIFAPSSVQIIYNGEVVHEIYSDNDYISITLHDGRISTKNFRAIFPALVGASRENEDESIANYNFVGIIDVIGSLSGNLDIADNRYTLTQMEISASNNSNNNLYEISDAEIRNGIYRTGSTQLLYGNAKFLLNNIHYTDEDYGKGIEDSKNTDKSIRDVEGFHLRMDPSVKVTTEGLSFGGKADHLLLPAKKIQIPVSYRDWVFNNIILLLPSIIISILAGSITAAIQTWIEKKNS